MAIVVGVVDGKGVGLGGLLLPLLYTIRVGTVVAHESQPKMEKKGQEQGSKRKKEEEAGDENRRRKYKSR